MALSGIVFDFDGVLFDSEKHWILVENPYLRKYIPTWKDAYYAQLVGKSLSEVYQTLVDTYGFHLTAEQYFADYEMMAVKLYSELAKPLPKLQKLLEFIKEDSNVSVAIASSSKPDWIMMALRAHNLQGHFPIVITAHDSNIRRGKPAPDVYLEATRRLGLGVAQLVAIEDSCSGVKAARAANIFCVGLRNGVNDDQDLSDANVVVNGYGEISVDYLSELIK